MPKSLKNNIVICVAAAMLACASLFVFNACASNDKPDFIGEWKIANSEVTVVFSDTEFKLASGNKFDYTVDSGSKTITYTSGGAKGSAKYTFSADKQQLTLEENGGKTTVFNKVSSNGNAEPSAGIPTTVAPSADSQSANTQPQADGNAGGDGANNE